MGSRPACSPADAALPRPVSAAAAILEAMTEPLLDEVPADVEASSAWRALVRNAGTLVAGEGAARVFGLLTVLVLARSLGPSAFGLASVGMAVVGWISLVADSGTEVLTLRNVSREPARFREIAERILGLRLTMALGATVVYVLVVLFLARSGWSTTVYLGFAIAIPAAALNLRWIAVGVGGARAVAAGNVVARVVFLIGILGVATVRQDLALVGYAYGAGELAYALVVAAGVIRRHGFLRPRIDVPFWRETLRDSTPLMVLSLSRGALFAWDLFLISLVLGPKDAGFYSAGQKPVQFLGTAVTMFYVSFISSYSAASGPLAERVFRRSVRTSLAVTIPIAVLGSLSAAFVVPLAFGDRFAAAAPVLAVLAWKTPFSALSAPYSGLLLSQNRQLLVMRNSLVGASVNVVGNLIAVPTFGIVGAAVVGVISVATICALNYQTAVSRRLAPPFRVLFAPAA